ncbi:MAG TPA: aminopeptidase P N-terminal domain-containing protein, partial [Steroidobacteraceae bacterium]|nr:aminopeptidase P N-terminal domain-containing protein [Steroidobacteraceae bacterium]
LARIMGKGSIAILPAAPVRLRNNDVEYPYRQDSDFYYLTGFSEPEAVVVLVPGRDAAEYILFVRDRDPLKETWEGRRAGPAGAVERFAADDAFPISDLDEILPGLMENRERVYYAMGTHPEFDQKVLGWLQTLRGLARHGRHPPQEMIALDHVLHDMRLYKSRTELGLMRESGRIAAAAQLCAMRCTAPGRYEYEIAAEIMHEYGRHNATASYQPIVGGGANSCILHYRENDARLAEGDLLLVDAGCEYQYYASDITRTWPVSGSFTPAQREIYQIVLAAQQAAFAATRPGNHWNQAHDAAVHTITHGLVSVGLLQGRLPKLIKEGAYRKYFMHRTGHWLGMDVHDVGDYKVGDEWRVLEPGMVMTVEPGIYIPAGTRGVPKRYWNCGIRIEDDVVVTAAGCEVLTGDVPSAVHEVEAAVAARPATRQ